MTHKIDHELWGININTFGVKIFLRTEQGLLRTMYLHLRFFSTTVILRGREGGGQRPSYDYSIVVLVINYYDFYLVVLLHS